MAEVKRKALFRSLSKIGFFFFLDEREQSEKLAQLAGSSQIKSSVALFNESLTPFSSY